MGVHCVDCVKVSRAAARPIRSVLGFRTTKGKPLVTPTLIGLGIAVFIVGRIVWGEDWPWRLGLNSDLWQGEPWRIVTSGFAHFGVVHLLVTMVVLFRFGIVVEALLGWWRYLTVYVFSLLGSGAMLIVLGDPHTTHAGASGAVYGVLAAYFVLSRARKKREARDLMVLAGLWIAMGFFIDWLSWEGHLGGAIAGVLATLILVRLGGRRRSNWAVT